MQEVISWRFPEADITWKECRKGLEFNCLNRSEHADYIDGFFEGPLGDILQEENSDLLARCREAEDCVVIQGEIAEDDKLDYILR